MEDTVVDDADEQGMPWGQFNPYFQYVKSKDANNFIAKCKQCPTTSKLISVHKTSSSNLKNHLKHVHNFDEKKLAALKVKPPTPTAKATKRKSEDASQDFFAKKRTTQEDVHRVTDELVINETLSHRIVESPYFRQAVLLGCPSTLKVSCRKTFRKRLDGYRDEMHRNVSKAMDGVEFVATTADGWSKHGRGFLGVTSHWIDPVTIERDSAALALRRLLGRHTHELLARGLCKVTESYGLPTTKITRCSTDSASNFRKAFKMFSAPQNGEGGAEPDEPDVEHMEGEEEHDGHGDSSDEDEDTDDGGVAPVSMENALILADLEGITLPQHQRCGAHIINLIATVDTAEAFKINAAFKKVSESTTKKLKYWWRRQGRLADLSKWFCPHCNLKDKDSTIEIEFREFKASLSADVTSTREGIQSEVQILKNKVQNLMLVVQSLSQQNQHQDQMGKKEKELREIYDVKMKCLDEEWKERVKRVEIECVKEVSEVQKEHELQMSEMREKYELKCRELVKMNEVEKKYEVEMIEMRRRYEQKCNELIQMKLRNKEKVMSQDRIVMMKEIGQTSKAYPSNES
ncbi:Zinc finger BED domain-containing protein DAYSLEEPER [Frankliniella fusca]|uniref:Zinc finger BED domain-containing protein DAYSLEEPER n=1 Tax=Frankliniella fusca TaxID=407009 RepID=A0AAE1LFJ6_9NEOP|nr:Zinc finger BED domain-containing protein DAYSLEEPER [Frankliniella fusca]